MRYKFGTCQFQNIFLSTSRIVLVQYWLRRGAIHFFILQSLERICIKGHGDQCGCKGGDWLRIRCIKVPSISEHHLFPQFLPNASISFQYFPNLHRIIFCTDWKRGNVKNFIHLVSHWKRKDAREVWDVYLKAHLVQDMFKCGHQTNGARECQECCFLSLQLNIYFSDAVNHICLFCKLYFVWSKSVKNVVNVISSPL